MGIHMQNPTFKMYWRVCLIFFGALGRRCEPRVPPVGYAVPLKDSKPTPKYLDHVTLTSIKIIQDKLNLGLWNAVERF